VVSAIAGQTRARLIFIGEAGHAGTVPISLRHDALCAAAEFVLAAEVVASSGDNLLATVGEVGVSPGASNVIPGRVELTVDIRHPNDSLRMTAVRELEGRAQSIAARRGIGLTWQIIQNTDAVACDERLTGLLTEAIGTDAMILPSGAGHDAAALAALCPVAMLFIRCRRGVSHHPDEFASEEDIEAALEAMLRFIKRLAAENG
jgi:allantoate deiminase